VLWVACAPTQAILELDARTGQRRRTLKTNLDGGWFVEATPDGRKLYIPHLEGKAITVLDLASGVARALYSGSTQFGIAAAPNGREVWVSDSDRHQLTIVNTATDTIAARVSLGPPPQGQPAFARLRFTPDGRSVAVVRGGQFLLLDAQTRALTASLDLPHAGKVLAISPDNRFAAVSHPGADRVSIIDLRARTVRSTFPTGKAPDGVAWVR
jgi:DNA-binding beta-propeller fold protein YncE